MSMNVIIILVIALAHTFIHYSVFSPTDSEQKGISGFSVTNVEKESSGTFSLSLLIIGFEWATLIFLVVFSMTREKINVEPKVNLKIDKERMRKLALSGTEIDMLYEVIRNNHSVKLSTIEKLFDVDKDKVLSWGRTLAEANLAYINYPNMGEPEMVAKQ